jgi:hypothetical protein
VVRAVARYDRRPCAARLLRDRLARGWRPQPSPMVEGPRVLGFAACLEAGTCPPIAE